MPAPAALVISVRETLDLLDGPFSSFAKGVAEGRYAFWLGSGISLGRVPGLRGVIAKVVEFIRLRIDHGNPACKFAQAMQQILALAALSADERARSDLSAPFATWPDRDAIVDRLLNNYSKLLGITLEGEDFDFLVWNAVDVRDTYGNPALRPDVEHFCIAALTIEGVASELVSANWDALIERAVAELSGNNPALAPTVAARPADLQQPRNRTRLIKFHGCAALATQDEPLYRPWLVATHSQIAGWCGNASNAPFINILTGLIGNKPTLMMGLSAQDANIQHVFAAAANQLAWQWPGDRPSYVFSEDELGLDQRSLLMNVYGNQVTPATLPAILASARIQAFAKPLLTALLLHVLCAKLQALIELAPSHLPEAERAFLRSGVVALRNGIAAVAQPNVDFMNSFVDRWGRALQLIRGGRVSQPNVRYQPLTAESTLGLQANPDLEVSGVREIAAAVGLLGAGVERGDWSIAAEPLDPSAGLVAVSGAAAAAAAAAAGAGAAKSKVFLTSNAYTAALLQQEGYLVEAEGPILIQAQRLVPAMSRSPRGAPGRTGRIGVREVSIAGLLEVAVTFDQLYEAFRQELTL